jgi:multiple sugar transport system ATP-binding protein
LRALHDRMHATTVYVTHDQLEAMQMGDKIVVMNHGVVEQFGTPQAIYDHPATMFVAEFIGSPPMNFLRFDGAVTPGDTSVSLGAPTALPALREGARGALALGVRPEHVAFADSGSIRGRVEAVEYLGTTQIVTLSTPHGTVKARTASSLRVTPGDTPGLALTPETLSLFDATSGRALRTAANEGVLNV